MITRLYVVALCLGYFLLWAWFSEWSLDRMIFLEGHSPSYPIWPWAPLTRVGAGFVVFVIAVLTVTSGEIKRR